MESHVRLPTKMKVLEEQTKACLLCRASAKWSKLHEDVNMFEWKCEGCGPWRVDKKTQGTIEALWTEDQLQACAKRVRKSKREGKPYYLVR